MKLGLEVFLEKEYKQFRGKRIGLITNMTGVNQKLLPAIDLFFEHPDIELTALYAPEHGIRGDAKEGEQVESSIDPHTQLPVYSLYGNTRKPTEEMLADVDVLVFDLQDIGSRYYTYIYTMAYVMEASKEFGKEIVILDRPNPISGDHIEGNLVEEGFRSFVGLLPIPNRHGLTVGELALLFKNEYGYDCDLTVIAMEGWSRKMYYDDTGLIWVAPSPNTTDIDMNLLYTGTCLIEGTNLSEGRGTARPFEQLGAPYIDGYQLAKEINNQSIRGIIARPTSFVPTYQKHEGKVCSGVQLHVTDREQVNSLYTGIIVLETIARMYPEDFVFNHNEQNKYFFDLLAGTNTLRQIILDGKTDEFFELCEQQSEAFAKIRSKYILYK